MLGFDALLFLSALTRGGILQSVHAYAFSPAGPILIIGIIAATFYTLRVARWRKVPVFNMEAHTGSMNGKLMLAGLASLLGMFIVCFAGVIVPTIANIMTGSDLATSFDFYNYGNAPFVMLFVASTLLCGLEQRVFKAGLGVLGAALLTGAAFVFLCYPTPNPIANFGIPLTLAALALVVVGGAMSLAKSFSGRLASRHLIHFGTLVVVLGVFLNAPIVATGDLADVQVSAHQLT
jgi:cytochrome c biogenesis factor